MNRNIVTPVQNRTFLGFSSRDTVISRMESLEDDKNSISDSESDISNIESIRAVLSLMLLKLILPKKYQKREHLLAKILFLLSVSVVN